MRPDRPRSKPILITSAAGAIGSIGRDLTEMLLAKGHRVRALVNSNSHKTHECHRSRRLRKSAL